MKMNSLNRNPEEEQAILPLRVDLKKKIMMISSQKLQLAKKITLTCVLGILNS